MSSDFTRKVNFMGDYLKLIRDTLLLLLVGVLILYSLFMTVCCVWFGMNPITFIQVFHFGKDISVTPDNISSSSSVVLEIGENWEEGTLFAVQAQEIEEISLEAFQAMNETLSTAVPEEGTRAFQAWLRIENKNYRGTETTAYGYVYGMYAIVHAFEENFGPLLGNTYGLLGLTEEADGKASAIPKGEAEEFSYAFLVPEGENEIKIAIEILDEENGKNLYRKEYRYSIPDKDEP